MFPVLFIHEEKGNLEFSAQTVPRVSTFFCESLVACRGHWEVRVSYNFPSPNFVCCRVGSVAGSSELCYSRHQTPSLHSSPRDSDSLHQSGVKRSPSRPPSAPRSITATIGIGVDTQWRCSPSPRGRCSRQSSAALVTGGTHTERLLSTNASRSLML